MADYSFEGRPHVVRDIAAQERAVKNAQEKLNRIERMRDAMARQVAEEQKRLDQMRQQATDFTYSRADELPRPSGSGAAPNGFESQFDRFGDTPSNRRLQVSGGEGPGSTALQAPERLHGTGEDSPGTGIHTSQGPAQAAPPLEGQDKPLQNQSFFRNADRDRHWTELDTDPGTSLYVSGYYLSSGEDSKQYEYQIGYDMLPVKVGETVRAIIHLGGHQAHFSNTTGKKHDWYRRFVITDIYSTPKYGGSHDTISRADAGGGVMD